LKPYATQDTPASVCTDKCVLPHIMLCCLLSCRVACREASFPCGCSSVSATQRSHHVYASHARCSTPTVSRMQSTSHRGGYVWLMLVCWLLVHAQRL
jgi:hypothetical protein